MQKSFLKDMNVNNLNEMSERDTSTSDRAYLFDKDSQSITREYYDADGVLICREEVRFWRTTRK